jgi:hypothetical protein
MDNKSYILALLIIFYFVPSCFSDGGVYITGLDDSLIPMTETDQMCAISYDNGVEEMVLSVGADLQNGTAVWIFPVPSKPGVVETGIEKGFPEYGGKDLRTIIRKAIKDSSMPMYMTQIWTLADLFPMQFGLFNVGGGSMVIGGGFDGIQVYSHQESMGLTTEIVSADDGASLLNYLRSKGMNPRAGSLNTFEDYAGKGYSFVVSWVSDGSKYKSESWQHPLSIHVKFPTPKMYYPLKPTSMYGETYVPATLYIKGHVTPEIYADIRPYSKTGYYLAPDGGKYTKVVIDAPSKKFTDDLWISDDPPLEAVFLNVVASNTMILVIAIFLFCSILASLFAGLISFAFGKEYDIKELVIYGLANILSLAGVTLAVFMRDKEPSRDQDANRGSAVALIAAIIGLGLLVAALFGDRMFKGDILTILWGLGSMIPVLIVASIFFPPLLLAFLFPFIIFYLASRDDRWAYVFGFSIAFIVCVFYSTTLISQALYSPDHSEGFENIQPLSPSISYQNSNFTASFTNAYGAPVKIERLGMFEEISGEICKIKPLQEKTIKAGGTFTLRAVCPSKADGESYSLGIEIGYRAADGEETPMKTERGAMKGQGDAF